MKAILSLIKYFYWWLTDKEDGKGHIKFKDYAYACAIFERIE
jgi:hypothetical protein